MKVPEFLKQQLSLSQLKAVDHLHGPLLVLAGAGSGKTRALTYRIAHLVAQGEAHPSEILAVTFTNKAAQEMKQRTQSLLSEMGIPTDQPMWISTFHSICVRILREHAHHLGYPPFFVIYDDSDQLSMIQKILKQLNINTKLYPPKSFKAKINDAKSQALDPAAAAKGSIMNKKCLQVYQTYEAEMKKANAMDFGDLLLKTYELFCKESDVLEIYQYRFKFILVDEYQDTNRIQYLLVRQLADKHRNLCVVGDEDQSIYSWRGADIRNILNFGEDFTNCQIVKLEENYRSTGNIVRAANALIQNNSLRKDKTLFTKQEPGSLITVHKAATDYDEAKFVVDKLRQLLSLGTYTHKDFAIFYRTNAQSRVLEDQCRLKGLPYRIVGGMKFYHRKEIKDLLAYLSLSLNPQDDIAFKRIINTPLRGIGKATVETIEEVAHQQGQSMFHSIEQVINRCLVHARACKNLLVFSEIIKDLSQSAQNMKVSEIFLELLEKTGYCIQLKTEGTPESKARIENIEELGNAISQFEKEKGPEATLRNFLEQVALASDMDALNDRGESITLMTLHISKGLEYPNVFIVGLEGGLFPGGNSDLEEERRLAYVGMTRARENLFLTYARQRRVWGQMQWHPPSQFIDEIPKKYLKHEAHPSKLEPLHFDQMPNYEDLP